MTILSGECEVGIAEGRASTADAGDSGWRWMSSPAWKAALFLLADCLALLVAHVAARGLLRRCFHLSPVTLEPGGYQFFYLPFFAVVLYVMKGYTDPTLRRPEKELALSIQSVSLCFLGLLSANFVLLKGLVFSRYLVVCWYMLALVLVVCARFLLRAAYIVLWAKGKARQRTLLIGCPERLARYRERLELQRHCAYEFLGIIPLGSPPASGESALPMLGPPEKWEQVAIRDRAQMIVVAVPDALDAKSFVAQLLRRCRELRLDVELASDLLGGSGAKLEFDSFSGCMRQSGTARWSRNLQRFGKAVLDRVAGLVGSLFTLLLIPPIWILLKLHDGGPLFYASAFVGRGGRTEYYLKFRSMVVNADEVLRADAQLKVQFAKNQKLKRDPRVTPVGRFMRKYSIDEFPQFFSLLTGQLTLVGPRTIRQEEGFRYGELLPKLLSVKPGLTGYWQVMGRQNTTYDDRVQMDMFYIDHWSLWLDLVIIAKTFWKVVTADGAY